ncbi:hypothetical protein QUF75_12750 [Desulfococcaceae bacterium HSG7]|nr:hypothetical protein [Desulfococcaceae bacterium HSG7]
MQKKREKTNALVMYMERRPDMPGYKELIEEDLPIATGIVEGAARYVVGERMDCSGMRWIRERAEALLRLRCIELDGDRDRFFRWSYARRLEKLKHAEKVRVRTTEPLPLPVAA